MRLVTAFLAWGATCFAAEALAEGEAVVTVMEGASSSITERVVQEMEVAGLTVRRGDPPSAEAAPLVVVVPADPTAPIELYVLKGGATVFAASVPAGGPDDTRALRVAELARALSFRSEEAREPALEPEPADSATPSAAMPAPKPRGLAPLTPDWGPAPEPVPASSGPSFDFGLGAGLGLQAPGISMQIEATATLWPHDHIGVGVFASAPAVGAEIAQREGTATVRSAIFGLELATAPVERGGSFAILLNPGLALGYLHASGRADSSTNTSLENGTVVGAGYGRAELRARIVGPLCIRLGLLGGATFPPVDIRFASRVVSTFSPIGSASLGMTVEP